METFSTRQTAVIAAANKTVAWLFRVTDNLDNVYYWSTGTQASSGGETIISGAVLSPGSYSGSEWERAHTFKIVNFSGIALRRSKSESGIHAPNDVSFSIVNAGNGLAAENFSGGTVRIGLVIDDGNGKELCGSWRFRIKSASPYAQQIDVTCEDFLQEYLTGSYPNTRLISDIFPVADGVVPDTMCIPEPYGTCYIPLRSVFAGAARYYMLGDTANTYTIDEVRSPRELGAKITWASAGFTFPQSTVADAAATDWRMFQAIIADSDGDGTADAAGIFMSGDRILDVPTKFSRSDTASVTDPAEIIRRVLRNMGVLDYDLDLASFDTAAATFATWSLAWNFAFYYKENRRAVLSRLLAMCHCALIVGEKISLQVLSKASRSTITDAEVLKPQGQEVGQDTFRYTDAIAERVSDSGYVAFQQAGESQDQFLKILVPAKSATDVKDAEVITFPGVQNNQHVQKLGTIYYQRKFLKAADISFIGKGTLLALRPDDVITVNYADYGGTYNVLIDEITINPDVSVGISAIRFSEVFDDWEDLAPGAITIASDAPTTAYSPVVAGPDGTVSTGNLPNALPGRLRVGQSTNYILLEPASPLRVSLYSADTERLRIGNLNGFLGYVVDTYGLAIGDSSKFLKYDPANGLRLGGAGVARIELDLDLARISVKDATDATKTAMGYLNGLAKNDGTGNWGAGDYGFWAAAGDNLKIDGDAVYKSGDWIVENDGAFLINNASDQTIVRLGTVAGVKGLYIYDTASPTQNLLAKFATDGFYLGAAGETGDYIKYTAAGGLVIRGDLTLSGTIGWSQITDDNGHQPSDDADVTLSAINGGLTLTGGGLTLSAGGSIKGGQTAYAAGTGFFLGYESAAYKFSIGNGTKYLTWDGSALTIRGTLNADDITAGTLATERLAFSDLSGLDSTAATKLSGIATGADVTLSAINGGLSLTGGGLTLDSGGTIQAGYTAPGDDNTTPGAGLKITGGKIEAYGGDQTFGGTILSSDGNYLICIGKYLTATGLTKRYPLNNATNFTADGRIHGYRWNGTGWVEYISIGDTGSNVLGILSQIAGRNGFAVTVQGASADAILGSCNSDTTDGIGVRGVSNSSAGYGVWGESNGNIGVYGYGGAGYGGHFNGAKSPVVLYPSASASAPSHTAGKGSLWVTSAGVLYINTSGSTTWQKVGAQ